MIRAVPIPMMNFHPIICSEVQSTGKLESALALLHYDLRGTLAIQRDQHQGWPVPLAPTSITGRAGAVPLIVGPFVAESPAGGVLPLKGGQRKRSSHAVCVACVPAPCCSFVPALGSVKARQMAPVSGVSPQAMRPS